MSSRSSAHDTEAPVAALEPTCVMSAGGGDAMSGRAVSSRASCASDRPRSSSARVRGVVVDSAARSAVIAGKFRGATNSLCTGDGDREIVTP